MLNSIYAGSGDQGEYCDFSRTNRTYCFITLIYYITLNDAGIGNESGYCYLSPTGRIYCTAIPIGVVLLFDFVALIRTMIAISRVQQVGRNICYEDEIVCNKVLCFVRHWFDARTLRCICFVREKADLNSLIHKDSLFSYAKKKLGKKNLSLT